MTFSIAISRHCFHFIIRCRRFTPYHQISARATRQPRTLLSANARWRCRRDGHGYGLFYDIAMRRHDDADIRRDDDFDAIFPSERDFQA